MAKNCLHELCDEHHFQYFLALQSSIPRTIGKRKAIERFLLDTIDAHRKSPYEEQATLHYNFANFQMNEGNYLAAVIHYNAARKKMPDYLNRAYFLREFASCHYFRHKFSCAASLYTRAMALDQSSQVAICAGDALMYSGAHQEAHITFQNALERAQAEDDHFAASEAWLKIWLCSWLPDFLAATGAQSSFCLSHRPFWLQLVSEAESKKQYYRALAAILAEGFISEQDDALWADAIAFAFNTKDPGLIQSTLSCAVWRFGHSAYGKFRALIKGTTLPTGMLELLDGAVSDLENKKHEAKQRGFVARFQGPTSSRVRTRSRFIART